MKLQKPPAKVRQQQLPTLASAMVRACNVREKEATPAKFRWCVKQRIISGE